MIVNIVASSKYISSISSNSLSKIGSNYFNVSDIIVICGEYITGNSANAVVSIGWEELY